jgi:hypothetical protein
MNPFISIQRHLHGSESEPNVHIAYDYSSKKENLVETNNWRDSKGWEKCKHA